MFNINKILFIYLFSTIIFQVAPNKFHYVKMNPRINNFLTTHKKKLLSSFKNKNLALLLNSFITGNKTKIPKTILTNYKLKSLKHLFTPSGIHYSSVYIVILFLMSFVIKIKKIKIKLFISIISLSVFYLQKFYSLKRIVLFYLFKNISNFLGLKLSNFTIFLSVFVIDYYFGSFQKSPLSFTFSFLFLGTILSCGPTLKMRFVGIMFAQLIISIVLDQNFNIIYSIQGFLLTSLFSFIFPIVLANYLLPMFNFSEPIIKIFNMLVTL